MTGHLLLLHFFITWLKGPVESLYSLSSCLLLKCWMKLWNVTKVDSCHWALPQRLFPQLILPVAYVAVAKVSRLGALSAAQRSEAV